MASSRQDVLVSDIEENHQRAGGSRKQHHHPFEEPSRGMAGEFRADIGADHQTQQHLYEEHEVQIAGEQIAESAECGDRQDDEHGGADRLEERHGEKDEQRKLRAEYIEAFKQSLVSQLENTTIIEPDGTRRKVRRRDENTSERRGNGIKQ